MQYTNNSIEQQAIRKRKRLIILGAIIFFILCITLVIYGIYQNQPGRQEVYVDPGTGRTISDPAGKVDETYGSKDNDVSLIGGDELLDYGMNFDQLTLVKTALSEYTKKISGDKNEVSVWIKEITYSSKKDNNGRDKLTVPITVKRSYKTTMVVEYFDITKVHVVVYKENSTDSDYDSGILPTGDLDSVVP